MVKAGGEVNIQIKDGKWKGSTPLLHSSRNGHVEVVKSLIRAGGKVNSQTAGGSTPLHWASRRGHVEVITALLAAGADKRIKNKRGKTPHEVAKNPATRNALK